MANKHFLYTLAFMAGDEPVVFYVGHTNDMRRRLTEHRSAVKDLANQEYKYQWIRGLESAGIKWTMTRVVEIESDEDSEYEWILQFARDNHRRGIAFYNDLPLTNMRAGDFYWEIIDREDIVTRDEIREYRIRREQERSVDYKRVRPTDVAQGIIDDELVAAEQSRLDSYREQQQQLKKELAYQEMIADPERQRRIAAETLKLQLLDGIITAREHDLAVKQLGGYPEWTTLPDQRVRK